MQKYLYFKFKLFLSFHTNAKCSVKDIQILLIIARHDSYQLRMYTSDPDDNDNELDYLLIRPCNSFHLRKPSAQNAADRLCAVVQLPRGLRRAMCPAVVGGAHGHNKTTTQSGRVRELRPAEVGEAHGHNKTSTQSGGRWFWETRAQRTITAARALSPPSCACRQSAPRSRRTGAAAGCGLPWR